MSGDTSDVVGRLAAYEHRIRRLMEIVGENGHLKLGSKSMAQQTMRLLKDDLRDEDEEMTSVSGSTALTETEATYLRPAIHGAITKLRSRWDSDPIRSRWFGQLQDALAEIVRPLNQLRGIDDLPPSNEGHP